jgi:hypothetical protein
MRFIVTATGFDTRKAVDRKALEPALAAALEKIEKQINADLQCRADQFLVLQRQANKVIDRLKRIAEQEEVKIELDVRRNEAFTVANGTGNKPARTAPAPRTTPSVNGASAPEGGLTGPQQRILDELAELRALGIDPAAKPQLGLLCGYTNCRSGGFTEPLGDLVKSGLVFYPRGGEVQITADGLALAKPVSTPATTEALQERILAKLDGPRAKILRELIWQHPNDFDKAELGQKLGYSNPRSGGFTEPLGSLRELGLIDYPTPGRVVALPVLFLR